ncbi:MAG: hypothetical protein WCC59_05080 [Terriglobales bacterium]
MSSSAPGPAQEPYYLGPPSVAERAQKAPYRPAVAGKIGFFLGPFAAALVLNVNLRRMGHAEKAKRIMSRTFLAAIPIGIILMRVPNPFGRFVGLGIEIATALIFPPLQQAEFIAWQQANPDIAPSNGWRAIGWGILGVFAFFVLLFVLAIMLPKWLVGE